MHLVPPIDGVLDHPSFPVYVPQPKKALLLVLLIHGSENEVCREETLGVYTDLQKGCEAFAAVQADLHRFTLGRGGKVLLRPIALNQQPDPPQEVGAVYSIYDEINEVY